MKLKRTEEKDREVQVDGIQILCWFQWCWHIFTYIIFHLIDIPIPEKEEDSVNQLECHESTYFRDSLSSAISLSKASIGFSLNMRIFTLKPPEEDSKNNCYFIPLARNRRYWRTYIRSCLVGKSIDERKHPRYSYRNRCLRPINWSRIP